jgi:transposase InsO family protein
VIKYNNKEKGEVHKWEEVRNMRRVSRRVLCLFARKLIAWSVSRNPNTELVSKAFRAAYENRGKPSGVMFHSDRGTQYTSAAFRKMLDNADFVQSFSAKGHPYDNAVAESFFKFLKLEEIGRRTFAALDDLQLSLHGYATFYNSQRPHSANDGQSPDDRERAFCSTL